MALWLVFTLLAFQQDEILSENLNISTVQDRFTEALNKYNSVQRNESGAIFEEIVAQLEEKQAQNEIPLDNGHALSDDERFIMTESLKFLAALTFPDGAEAQFTKLINFNPAYEIDPKDFPPKIVGIFDGLKSQMVGQIRVIAIDDKTNDALAAAKLFLDGKYVGPIDGETEFEALAGVRALEIRKTNYAPYFAELEIAASAMAETRAALTRTAAELVLVTAPAGATVFMNGVEVGVTDGEAPRDYRARLDRLGVAMDEVGALSIDNLQPGEYDIALRKLCFKEMRITAKIPEPTLIYGEPKQLETAGAQLTVKAAGEATGIVFLDQARVGFLPVEDYMVCPGEYVLRVRFTDSEYIKKVRFEDGDIREIIAEPLPSIAWFGMRGLEEGPPPEDVERWLFELKTWNVQRLNPDDAGQIPVDPFPLLFSGAEMTGENREILTRNVRADLYMAARIVRKKEIIRYLEVAFWSPLSKRIQIMLFDFRELAKFKRALDDFDRFPTLTKPWLGLTTAKLRDLKGCRILEVHPNGPLADKASEGEFLLSLNGNVFRNPGELLGIASGQEAALEIGDRQIRATPVETIAETPFDDRATAPQAMLAKFEKLAKYHPDKQTRDSALFNQARYQFFLGDFKQAFDIFSTMTIDAKYGINQGTLFYYQGLCFLRLRLNAEAVASFQQSLNYPNATLFDAYGPKTTFWAEAALKNAGQ